VSKQKKRDMYPYPALKKELNLKIRQDEIEIDYLNKLTKEEAEWLNKFNEEYVNASLDREELNNNIHNTKELKQDCDRRNHSRRKCAYTVSKSKSRLNYIEDKKVDLVIANYEDRLIKKIDRKNKKASA